MTSRREKYEHNAKYLYLDAGVGVGRHESNNENYIKIIIILNG